MSAAQKILTSLVEQLRDSYQGIALATPLLVSTQLPL
jgi:hypothetical protein